MMQREEKKSKVLHKQHYPFYLQLLMQQAEKKVEHGLDSTLVLDLCRKITNGFIMK